ncbi:MAG TPA: hypothetical protein VHO91_10115, partial [Rhodopila sp.]|nr:hypothetical protein [Rhodopila sp.]
IRRGGTADLGPAGDAATTAYATSATVAAGACHRDPAQAGAATFACGALRRKGSVSACAVPAAAAAERSLA